MTTNQIDITCPTNAECLSVFFTLFPGVKACNAPAYP